MNFKEYQEAAFKTALYPGQGTESGIFYTALGLAGEAGEVANQVKKIMRDDFGVVHPTRKAQIRNELGDVLWYISQACIELGLEMDDVAQNNIARLRDRQERGTLRGSGDR